MRHYSVSKGVNQKQWTWTNAMFLHEQVTKDLKKKFCHKSPVGQKQCVVMDLCIMGWLSQDLPSYEFNIVVSSSFQSLTLWKLSWYFYRLFIGSWEGKQGSSCCRPPPHSPGAQVQWQLGSSLLQDTSTLRELQQAKTRSWPLHWDKPGNLDILNVIERQFSQRRSSNQLHPECQLPRVRFFSLYLDESFHWEKQYE